VSEFDFIGRTLFQIASECTIKHLFFQKILCSAVPTARPSFQILLKCSERLPSRHTILYQRWTMVEYWSQRRATIFQRWVNVEIWSIPQHWQWLKNGCHFDIESTLKYGRYLNIDDGWKMVVSLMFSWLWNINLFCLFPSSHSYC